MKLHKSIEGAAVGALALSLGVLAYLHPGVPATEVDLNDGGLWVTNQEEGLIAHLNYQSRTLDGGLDPQTRQFDVSQEANSVVLHDGANQGAAVVETATVTLTPRITLTGLSTQQGGDTVLVADPDKGKVWATTVDGLSSFTSSMTPLAEELETPRVAVGRDGTGFVITGDGKVSRVTGDENGFTSEAAGEFSAELSSQVQFSVAGDELVAFDEGKIHTTARSIEVPDAQEGKLQQPSHQGGIVSIATRDALLRVPLDGAETTRIQVPQGQPTAPVDVAGCAYGAWSGSGAYVRDCPSETQDLNDTNDTLAKATDAVFRVSRDIVAINDAAGNIYLPDEAMIIINNWDLIRSQIEDEQTEDDQTSDEVILEQTVVENQEQEPPQAKDDEFGARVGSTTTLPVLLNDTDPDGDVLTTELVDVPEGAEVSLGREGRSAQVTLGPEQKQPITFTYRAFDGTDHSNTATVQVTPRTEEENQGPVRKRDNLVSMSEQATVQYSVLPDWIDPEGDPIYLVNATSDEGTAVTFRQDGYLSLRDLGTAGAGRRTVKLTVSDGTLEKTEELRVQVSPGTSNLPPIANADHYSVNVGEDVVLRPLDNDTDPNGESLMLSTVSSPAQDEAAEVDYDQGTILFSSTRVGSHELTYEVTDGPNTAQGKVRIDVNDPTAADPRPAAQNDLALLPENASVLVPVLTNDNDPAGGVLGVQSVSVDDGLGLTVEVIHHAVLRISAPAGLKEPKTLAYTVSNGKQSATARVLVLPQPPRATNQAPVALDDSAVVRTGDIVAIPVLENDFSPTDLELSVDPEVEVRGDDLGEVFVSGELVRFRAGDQAGSVNLVYTLRDAAGNRASAKINLAIKDFDAGNTAPKPEPVTARIFAGKTSTVAIPLDGLDPDGDSVELVEGASQGPKLGSVKLRGGYLEYTAAPKSAGTDTFAYRVTDRFGQTGEAMIRVGVVPAPEANQLPVAVPDQITVRPTQKVEIPVTANDVDPDGDRVRLVKDAAKTLDSWDAQFATVGQKIQLIPPDKEGTYQFSYEITDGRGAPVTGYATVIVDEDALLVPPVAEDDRVAASEVRGKQEVEVPVLDNDSDPDGADEDLKIAVEQPARVENGKVLVPTNADAQVVLYTVTDVDNQKARAAIFVPGSDQAPTLDPEKIPATVKGGETLQIKLDEFVLTREGHDAKLTSAESVLVQNSEGMEHGVEIVDDTTIAFTPDQRFHGATTVTFEVHDGDSLEDPRALRATLQLPVEVTSSGLTPPELQPSPIEVAQGEPAISVNLRDMVNDPDPGDNEKLKFTLLSGPDTVRAKVNGQQIEVSAAPEAQPSTGNFTIQVEDGSTDPVEMTVPVSVVRSNRPLMTTTVLNEPDARVGQAKTFDLAQAITNPFADQNGEITILNPQVSTGAGRVSVEGMQLTVTPSEIGTMVVNYTAQDATKDSSRNVTGQVTLTVKDLPLAPSNLTAKSDVSRTVELSWSQGDLRGGKLENFIVQWNGGSQECGVVTNCRITGLTNNVEHTFTVVQVTEVGQSPPSNPASARPDVKPNQPAVPTTQFGDQQIELSWPATVVPDGGSPVTKYNIQVSPAVGGRSSFETTGTSFIATGLTNGTAYRFRIQAVNRYAENNVARQAEYLWSGWSAPETPAGAPSNLAAPVVQMDSRQIGQQPRANVRWNPPGNANGDSSFSYEVRESGGSTVVYAGSGNATTVTMNVSTNDRTFEYRATNKSGKWSEWSPVSNRVRAFTPPGAPGGFSLTPTGAPNTVRFSFSDAAGNGARPNEISYRWSAGGASGTVSNGQEVNSPAFANGSNVAVSLTAIANVNGETAQGPSAQAQVNAYGPPSAPSLSASGTFKGVNFNWSHDANSGGRSSTVTLSSSTGTPSDGASGTSGSTYIESGYGQQQCITVTATNTEEQSTSSTACGTAWQAPQAFDRAGGNRDADCQVGGQGDPPCYDLIYELHRFKPNSVVNCSVKWLDNSITHTYHTDSNGYARGQIGRWWQSHNLGFDKDVTHACSPR